MKMFGITSLKRKRSIIDKKGVKKIQLYDTSEIKQNGGYTHLVGICEAFGLTMARAVMLVYVYLNADILPQLVELSLKKWKRKYENIRNRKRRRSKERRRGKNELFLAGYSSAALVLLESFF
jgi:hypothetical protein